MKKRLLLTTVFTLAAFTAHAQVAENRAALEAMTNANIRANGIGAVTGPLLNAVFRQYLVSICTLNDSCTWNQLQSFAGGIAVDLDAVSFIHNLPTNHGGTGSTTTAGARVNLGLETITTIGDANYQMLVSDRNILTTVILSTTRTWTLPAASAVNPGQWIYVQDGRGNVSTSHYLIIASAGSDTVNGGSFVNLDQQFGGMYLQSDGVSRWRAFGIGPAVVDTLNAASIPTTALASGTAGISISGNSATATTASAVNFNNGLTASSAVAFGTLAINGGSVANSYAGFKYSTGGSYNFAVGITGFGSAGNGLYFQPNNATYTNISFLNSSGSTVGSISGTASATAYNTSSDARLKQHISETADGLDTLMKIPVRDFEFKSAPGKRVQGFIAQEVQPIYPVAVTTNGDDGKAPLGNSGVWGVDYGRLSPLIVRAVQQQQEEIVALKKEIALLKKELHK